MSTPTRKLNLRSEDEIIAEVNHLRKGYRKSANWSLPQISWHLGMLIDKFLAPPTSTTPTPEEAAKKAGFVDVMLATRQPPPGIQAPPQAVPSPDLTDVAIDHFIESLKKMKAYPHALVGMGPCGPVKIEEFRQSHCVHAEHHLGFLIPTTR